MLMSNKSYQKRLEVFKAFVDNLSTLSKCTEKQVAAIITDSELTQVYSIGINGGPTKLADCMCMLEGKYGCIHAEINALVKCKVDTTGACMFITLSPCKQCAAAIINAGISTVYFLNDWKDMSGLNLLSNAGIKLMKI